MGEWTAAAAAAVVVAVAVDVVLARSNDGICSSHDVEDEIGGYVYRLR